VPGRQPQRHLLHVGADGAEGRVGLHAPRAYLRAVGQVDEILVLLHGPRRRRRDEGCRGRRVGERPVSLPDRARQHLLRIGAGRVSLHPRSSIVTHDASGVSTNDVVPSLLVTVPDSAGASPKTKSAVPVVPSDAENVSCPPRRLGERHDARGEVGAGDSGVRP
jgi:hypothetical protein